MTNAKSPLKTVTLSPDGASSETPSTAPAVLKASQLIRIAISPDTDDHFMVHALREGWIDPGPFRFEFISDDIQVLNQAARQATYDVTAISVAAYPALADTYMMMQVGASVGDDYGPAVVIAKNNPLAKAGLEPLAALAALAGRRIAVPGLMTSAFMSARALIGEFEAVPMLFRDIEGAVLSGEVDAGILIHELQIAVAGRGMYQLADLGTAWGQRFGLPLPLGANAIRRSLGHETIAAVTAILRASIVAGLERRSETLAAAMAAAVAPVDVATGDRYIDMYVNERTLTLMPDLAQAIEQLYKAGASAGLCPALTLEGHIAP